MSGALRIYAWFALIGWFIGIPTTMILGAEQGKPPWPCLLVLAACVPVVPLVMIKGFDILGLPLSDWGLTTQVPSKAAAPFAVVISLALMVGFGSFAFSTREADLARERVREFVQSLGDEARVLVDGEYFLGERAQALLGPLSRMERIVTPAHKSAATGGSWVVKMVDGERWMELELRRDSKRRREYWVYLLHQGSHFDLNEIGRIETKVLDDVVPIRPWDWNVERYRMKGPGR